MWVEVHRGGFGNIIAFRTLRQLRSLYDDGVFTAAEFAENWAKFLSVISSSHVITISDPFMISQPLDTAPTLPTLPVDVLSYFASNLSVRDANRAAICCRALRSATDFTVYAGAVLTALRDDDEDVREAAVSIFMRLPESTLEAHSGDIAAVFEDILDLSFKGYELLDCVPASVIAEREITIAAKLQSFRNDPDPDPNFRSIVLIALFKLDPVSREKYIPDFIAALQDHEPWAFDLLECFEPAVLEPHADALRDALRDHEDAQLDFEILLDIPPGAPGF